MTRKEKAREYAKKWRSINAVTPEQKAAIAAINKRNYHKRKERNPYRIKADCHHRNMKRNYPEACVGTDIDTDGLTLWMEAQEGKPCTFCGNPVEQIDHVIPFAKGGLHRYDNIRMLCGPCNRAKLDKTDKEYLEWIRSIVRFQTNY